MYRNHKTTINQMVNFHEWQINVKTFNDLGKLLKYYK